MRRIPHVIVILALCLMALFPITSYASNHGVIEGTVTDGATGEPVADLQVVLSTYVLRDGMPELIDEKTTTTDADGHYQFDGIDPERSAAYTTSTEFKGVTYSSGMIRFEDGGESTQTHDFTVYGTTEDESRITVESRGFVLAGVTPDEGELRLVDLFSLRLEGNEAYVAGDDGRSVEFPFPRSANEVNPLPDFDFGNPTIEGTVIYANTPLEPGGTTAALGYLISYTNDSVFMEFGNAYETAQYQILIPANSSLPDDLRPVNDDIQDAGTTEIGDQEYRVWIGPEVQAGDDIRFGFENLPQSAVAPNTLSRTEPVLLSAGAFVLAAAIIVMIVYRRQLHVRQPEIVAAAPTSPLGARRDDLVTQLRELEAAHEAGEIDDDVYQSERREILEQLRQISRQARGTDGDGAN